MHKDLKPSAHRTVAMWLPFVALFALMQVLGCSESDVTEEAVLSECDNGRGASAVGTACIGDFSCNDGCSDNWPEGDECLFGCDRYACVDGRVEQTEMMYLAPCWSGDGGPEMGWP